MDARGDRPRARSDARARPAAGGPGPRTVVGAPRSDLTRCLNRRESLIGHEGGFGRPQSFPGAWRLSRNALTFSSYLGVASTRAARSFNCPGAATRFRRFASSEPATESHDIGPKRFVR